MAKPPKSAVPAATAAALPTLAQILGRVHLRLILFAVAAQRMDYSVLGMVQYIGPTMVFVQAFFLSHEPLSTTQVVCFILIWCAIALFVWDLLAKRHAARSA